MPSALRVHIHSLSVQRKGLMKTLEITTFRFDTSDISGGRETGKILLTLWEMNTVGGVSLSCGQRRKSQCLVYHASVSISWGWRSCICVPILQACTVEMSHLVCLCNMTVYNIKHKNLKIIILQLQASSRLNFSEVPFISTERIAVSAVETLLTSAEFSLNIR